MKQIFIHIFIVIKYFVADYDAVGDGLIIFISQLFRNISLDFFPAFQSNWLHNKGKNYLFQKILLTKDLQYPEWNGVE